jgi:HEPN domain-containing protein
MRHPDDPEVASWSRKAGDDMRAASILLAQDPGLEGIICFLSQQAAEKLLKALFVAEDRIPPRTHDLDVLVTTLLERHPDLEPVRDSATFLKGFAVLPRYPTFVSPGTDPEAQSSAALAHASRIEHRVMSIIGEPDPLPTARS